LRTRLEFSRNARRSDTRQLGAVRMLDSPKGILVELPTGIMVHGNDSTSALLLLLLLGSESNINLDTTISRQGTEQTAL
jgi:hypothetical protein